MIVSSFHEPETGTLTHLLVDEASGAAAIIDPVWQYDPASSKTSMQFMDSIVEEALNQGYRIEWALETHAHADHLTAADQLRQRLGARIACGRGIRSVQKGFARVFNLQELSTDGSQFDRLFSDGDCLALGELEIRVMATPGHTADSVTYIAKDAAFVGDTLFAPQAGTARCDFPGGDATQLYESIKKIHSLPDDTCLFLCHDYPEEDEEITAMVTVARSRAENIHVADGNSMEDFVALRKARDAKLGAPRLIMQSLQVNIRAGALPEPDDNGVRYLRAPVDEDLTRLVKGFPAG